ncbi:MAG TPA: ATP-binding protein [Vicinamibacterales bacterium]|nr:ATP-binding protein [Vicinamibacterales bacterium]
MHASSTAPRTWLLNGATISAAVLACVIFTIDVVTPTGHGIAALYALPLLVGTFNGPPRFQLVAAGIESVLTVTGALLAPSGLAFSYVITNRAITLILIWTTAVVLARFRATWLNLQARQKDLDDVNFAIDHSAIVATTDIRGRITYVNDKFCEISKYRREELIGQDHRLLNSALHPKEFIRDLWVTIANGRIWRGEIRNRAKDGSIYWVDTTIVPFLNDRGKPYQYMALRYEITARKTSEERLREQEALARLGQMAAVVAHEVKNPIAGIRGALQVIASRMAPESRDRPVVGDIIARLDALNGIVHDLLVFARPRRPKSEPVDLDRLIRNSLELLHRDPIFANLQIDFPPSVAIVPADAEQLQMVVTNVLMNAAQAMAGSGDISIRVAQQPPHCTISIADSGPGMPAEVLSHVFDPFFTTKHRGTGLGMPIARRIMSEHGGSIEIETPDSGGTVVLIALPLRAGGTAGIPAATP